MDDLKLNASGIKDPTAYNAITHVEGRDDNSEVYAGDIWTRESMNGFKNEVLVIAVNNGIASILGLIPDCDCENRIAIEVDGKTLVSNLAMTQYARTSSLEKHIGQISEERLKRIKIRLAAVLGIETTTDKKDEPKNETSAPSDTAVIIAKRMVKDMFQIRSLTFENEMLRKNISDLEKRVMNAEIERLKIKYRSDV